MISLLKKFILRKILIIKYLIVGGINTCFGYAIYWVLLQLNFNSFLCHQLCAWIFDLLVSKLLQRLLQQLVSFNRTIPDVGAHPLGWVKLRQLVFAHVWVDLQTSQIQTLFNLDPIGVVQLGVESHKCSDDSYGNDDSDDNSDDDIGKAGGGGSSGLNYDSDEKIDEESGAQNELIDLGGGSSGAARSASHVKPLKGPGGM